MDYARHDSRLVSHTLDRLGYSNKMVKHRRQMFEDRDKLSNRHAGNAFIYVTTGGKGEGTALLDESDYDYMLILKDVVCTDHPEIINYSRIVNYTRNITIFLTEREHTHPGYTKLKLLLPRREGWDIVTESLIDAENCSKYLSNKRITEALETRIIHPPSHKPCTRSGPSVPCTNGNTGNDSVVCLPCFCPDIMERWVSRHRRHGWPSQSTIKDIARLDGHVVPVGFKGSATQDLEWRICYSLAELHLMKSLNPTQVKLYILLKQIAKSAIQKTCKEITSYVMKNVTLWLCELMSADMFCERFLLERLTDAVSYLKQCVADNRLPSYMIPERNLFAGRLDVAQRKELMVLFDTLLQDGGSMVFRCRNIRDAMVGMTREPERLVEFSEKRDKWETLALMMLGISDEKRRPGMSHEELEQILKHDEVYQALKMHTGWLEGLLQPKGEDIVKIEDLVNNEDLLNSWFLSFFS